MTYTFVGSLQRFQQSNKINFNKERMWLIIKRAEYQYAYYWNPGAFKEINEDSIGIQHVITRKGQVLMACICDGMGGLEQGEVASGYTVEEASKWFYKVLLPIVKKTTKGSRTQRNKVKKASYRLCFLINEGLISYGKKYSLVLGSTASIIVLLEDTYYIFHIGDSKIYEICNRKKLRKITKDHAVNDYTLTRCLGINSSWKPDFKRGKLLKNRGFLICSDGFTHKVDEKSFCMGLEPKKLIGEKEIERGLKEIGSRCIHRGERDNISAIYIRT